MMLNPTMLSSLSHHVMAIVNLTPDSFYGVSRSFTPEEAYNAVSCAVSDGATIVDIGGYSSRPGADDVTLEEEWRRVKMGLDAVSRLEQGVVVSVDTFRSEIVRRAVKEYGNIVVNDISAGEMDSDMIPTVAELGLHYVAMHMRGVPQTMQQLTHYDKGVVRGVVEYFRERVALLESAGIKGENIILDPGIGFAKSPEQSMELIAHLDKLCSLGYKVLVGVSRKSVIYRTLNITAEQSLAGSLAFAWESLRQGASIVRVHDVAATRQIVDLYNHFSKHI